MAKSLWIVRQSLSVMALLGTASGVASGAWLLTQAIAPQAAQAYTARVELSLDREVGESYNALIRRAEAAARAAAQRSFDSDLLITDVNVTIVGQSQGSAAPLLTLAVSRTQWRSRPNPQLWATYFVNARTLLGINDSPASGVAGISTPTLTSPPESPIPAQPQNFAPPVPAQPQSTPPQSAPSPSSSTPSSDTEPAVNTPNPVRINLPATPSGQIGLPRSILQPSN
jgi:hypothetical protein